VSAVLATVSAVLATMPVMFVSVPTCARMMLMFHNHITFISNSAAKVRIIPCNPVANTQQARKLAAERHSSRAFGCY